MITVNLCLGPGRMNVKRLLMQCVPKAGEELVFLDPDYNDHHYTVMGIQHVVGPEKGQADLDGCHIIFVDLIESPFQSHMM